jgi:hypothetical protein
MSEYAMAHSGAFRSCSETTVSYFFFLTCFFHSGLLLTDADTYAIAGGVYDGTWGFNGLVSAMCLSVFLVVNWSATFAAVLNSFLATVLLNVLIPLFAQVGYIAISQLNVIQFIMLVCNKLIYTAYLQLIWLKNIRP